MKLVKISSISDGSLAKNGNKIFSEKTLDEMSNAKELFIVVTLLNVLGRCVYVCVCHRES